MNATTTHAMRCDILRDANAAPSASGRAKRQSDAKMFGAPHAFHADYRPSYRKAEAEDGWQRMLAWFKRHGL